MFARRTAWELRPNRFAVAVEAHRGAGREILDLTVSNPTQCGLKYDEAAILAALSNAEALKYHPEPKGLRTARDAVVAYYGDRGGTAQGAAQFSPSSHQVVLTTSTSEAYAHAFRLLCDAGDSVLAPTPSYPLFEFLADLNDVKLVPYALLYDHGWQIDFRSLQAGLGPQTRAIILVHPNNPTGSFVKRPEREALNRLCAERELALIVDEVFLDYRRGAAMPDESAAVTAESFAFNTPVLTFTLSGISKISALPQMKLAWLVVSGPEVQRETALARLELIADTYLSMNAPVQLAAPVLLAQRHKVQQQIQGRVQANLHELDRQLAAQALCSRLVVEGGWYAVLRVPAIRSDEEFAIELLERSNVLVQPGYFFDFRGDGYLVVSLITPEDVFAEGIRRLLAGV